MGIRFIELAGESRALVEKIVQERVAAGLELFDLESRAPLAGEVPAERLEVVETGAVAGSDDGTVWELESVAAAIPASEELSSPDPEIDGPAAPRTPVGAVEATAVRFAPMAAARSRSSPLRMVAVAVLSALIGAGAVLTFYWLYVQPSIDALETRIDELAGSPGGPWQPPADEPFSAAVDGEASGEAAAEEAAAPLSAAGQDSELVAALRGWAAAWTEQRSADYLAYYASGFVPPDGLDRAAWEEARRARIARPQWIRVALTLVQVESTGPTTAEVRFVQSYRSERYKDLVRKVMLMVREDGVWKIAAERAVTS